MTEEWVCGVCGEEPFAQQPLVFCDGPDCEVSVHPDCYGSPLTAGIPDGPWYCDSCSLKRLQLERGDAADPPQCVLCPSPGGPLKRTTDGRWAHLSCSLWIPEVFFRLPDGRDAIDVLRVPSRRWRLSCSFCGKAGIGACTECCEKGCNEAFHITCAYASKRPVHFSYVTSKDPGAPDVVYTGCWKHAKKW